MGYSPFYQAIPFDSDLIKQVQADDQLAVVLNAFFPLGASPLDLDEVDKEEIEEVIDDLASQFFDSKKECRLKIKQLGQLIDLAEQTNPGLKRRSILLEKSYDILHDWLREFLAKTKQAASFSLFEASQELSPSFEGSLIPADQVKEGARILQLIDQTETTYDGPLATKFDQAYQEWRTLFLEAAQRGEALIVF